MPANLVEPGLCLAIGGTNARSAICSNSEIMGFESINTPASPEEFFTWMARKSLQAAEDGSKWVVAGFPGIVDPSRHVAGPMENVGGLEEVEYNVRTQLHAIDTATDELFESHEFLFTIVNDGELAAHAAAGLASPDHDKVAALILGTGVGAGVVIRDQIDPTLFHADRTNPYEIGHVLVSADTESAYEKRVSGPSLQRIHGHTAEDLPASHPAWQEVGAAVGQMSMLLALMNGVKLVVPTGGVGVGARTKYTNHLRQFMDDVYDYGNKAQRQSIPEITWPNDTRAQTFELYGAASIIRTLQAEAVAEQP